MARRLRDSVPPPLTTDFSDAQPIPSEAIDELLDLAESRLKTAENWRVGIEELLKTAKIVARGFGGLL